ncbi:hypothetical protein PMW_186 [Pseudomonas phage phiPMW]|uniref:Uncharacterized protein n=1 Tax=Pseudomonas phage phiPMW TaxID=1815582 RepID=A0A1S5R1N1_9CAUD|nr:hypothetical protein FDG97_gp164 [Pseudomonas phage phiPMW]ANA49311.1 hypothetical protein PMW_186 [Pseudomonas phage phiPMW]
MKAFKVRVLSTEYADIPVDSIQIAYVTDTDHPYPYYIRLDGKAPTEVRYTDEGGSWTEFEIEVENYPYAIDEVEVLEMLQEIPVTLEEAA